VNNSLRPVHHASCFIPTAGVTRYRVRQAKGQCVGGEEGKKSKALAWIKESQKKAVVQLNFKGRGESMREKKGKKDDTRQERKGGKSAKRAKRCEESLYGGWGGQEEGEK